MALHREERNSFKWQHATDYRDMQSTQHLRARFMSRWREKWRNEWNMKQISFGCCIPIHSVRSWLTGWLLARDNWLEPHPSSTQFDISKRWRDEEWLERMKWKEATGEKRKKLRNVISSQNIWQPKKNLYTCYKHSLHSPPIAHRFR